jgi:hypothetical protein
MIVRRLNPDFDMSFGHGLSDYAKEQEAVAQNVRTRLQLLKGEWFLDVDAGVPYLQEIMIKPANLPLAESLIKQTIIETDGVDELRSFDVVFNRNTRRLDVSATVSTIYGSTDNIRVTL